MGYLEINMMTRGKKHGKRKLGRDSDGPMAEKH